MRLTLAVPDRRMETQTRPVEPGGDAASAQIGFGRSAGHRTTESEQAAGRFRRAGRSARAPRQSIGARVARQGEKGAGLADRVGKTRQVPASADQIEQIAVLAGCGIAPFAGGAGTAVGTGET